MCQIRCMTPIERLQRDFRLTPWFLLEDNEIPLFTAVNYVAGLNDLDESFDDTPDFYCPVVVDFANAIFSVVELWGSEEAVHERFLPLVPIIAETLGDEDLEVQRKRNFMVADALVQIVSLHQDTFIPRVVDEKSFKTAYDTLSRMEFPYHIDSPIKAFYPSPERRYGLYGYLLGLARHEHRETLDKAGDILIQTLEAMCKLSTSG